MLAAATAALLAAGRAGGWRRTSRRACRPGRPAIMRRRSATGARSPTAATDAQFNLGHAYRLGRGVPQNMNLAEQWYERAARAGHVEAQAMYGLILFQNNRRQEAMPFIQRAAERGDRARAICLRHRPVQRRRRRARLAARLRLDVPRRRPGPALCAEPARRDGAASSREDRGPRRPSSPRRWPRTRRPRRPRRASRQRAAARTGQRRRQPRPRREVGQANVPATASRPHRAAPPPAGPARRRRRARSSLAAGPGVAAGGRGGSARLDGRRCRPLARAARARSATRPMPAAPGPASPAACPGLQPFFVRAGAVDPAAGGPARQPRRRRPRLRRRRARPASRWRP